MTPPILLNHVGHIETANEAKNLVKTLTADEKALLLDALQTQKPEVKETQEKLPQLEDKNFRIESTRRKKITDPDGVKVKVNPKGDVRECIEGDSKGTQFFTDDSMIRETKKAGKKLPASWTTYRDIIDKKYAGDYQKFLTGEKMVFCGWREPTDEKFYIINDAFNLRCADGSYFIGYKYKWSHNEGNRKHGFPVRCLQD